MSDLMTGVLIGIGLTYAFFKVTAYFLNRYIESQVKETLDLIKERTRDLIAARVEEDQGMFYVYNTEDNGFIAQGRSIAEIKTAIDKLHQDKRVIVTEGDNEVIKRLEATKVPTDA